MLKHIYPACYAFDVDDTLEVQGIPFPGPVRLTDVMQLRNQGCVTGICGNFFVLFKFFPDWYKFFSFYGPNKLLSPKPAHSPYKHLFLKEVKEDILAEKYIMIGNKRGDPEVRPQSQDDAQARLAGWTFIKEDDFARGKR